MNYAQFILFFIYILSTCVAGCGLYVLLRGQPLERSAKMVFLGESLLLGNILLVAELLILSLVGLFHAQYLWAAVGINFLFLLNPSNRQAIFQLLSSISTIKLPGYAFIAILLLFVFRNCYFLFDSDSLSTYLYTQRLWLEAGTSLMGNQTFDIRFFNPQYDAIAYSLGISIFGHETLFPELVTVFWRVICLLLVFGYTSSRFNGYYGLAATFFVLLNDHFFYSGANNCVILNAAVIAFTFASVYNFWEARSKNSAPHLLFALLFLSQIVSCKLYMLYAVLMLLVLGLLIQEKPADKIKTILTTKKYVIALVLATLAAALWYGKNFLVTGDPLFPFLAGKLHLWGWTTEQASTLLKFAGGLSVMKILKFFSFLFIWSGVNAAKYAFVALLTLPFVLLGVLKKMNSNLKEETTELCFWIGASSLLVFGICMALWQDPRTYRFPLGVFAFTTIFYVRFIARHLFNIKWDFVIALGLIVLSLQGYKIVTDSGGTLCRPSIKDNIDVLSNRLHMNDVIKKNHPEVFVIQEGLRLNPQKVSRSAWYLEDNNNAFLLPARPWISRFFSTTINWDSYESRERIISDLHSKGIDWIMIYRSGDKQLKFVSVEDFSFTAMEFDRHPKKTFYDYGFPAELTTIK